MSSVVELNQNHFYVNGQNLCVNVPGVILIFFKSQGCQHCKQLEPIFLQFARSNSRISYGIIDLTYNKNVVNISRNTKTPIQTVPQLYLYFEGRPYARFKGNKNIQSLESFVTNALDMYSQSVQQAPQHALAPQYGQQSAPQERHFVQQNMYGAGSNRGGYAPDTQSMPRQASGMMQHGGHPVASSAHPSMPQQCDPDDDDCLFVPDQIIPHNMPWESDLRKYAEHGKI